MKIAGTLINSKLVVLEDRQALVSRWSNQEMRMSSLEDGKLLGIVYHGNKTSSASIIDYYLVDQTRLAVLSSDGDVKIWSLENLQRPERVVQTGVKEIRAAAMSQHSANKIILLPANSTEFHIKPLSQNTKTVESRTLPRRIKSTSARNLQLELNSSGRYLVEVNGKNLWVYDIVDNTFVRKVKHGFRITSWCLAHNTDIIAIGDTRGKIT